MLTSAVGLFISGWMTFYTWQRAWFGFALFMMFWVGYNFRGLMRFF